MGIFDWLFGKKETPSEPKKEIEESKKDCCSTKEIEEIESQPNEKVKKTTPVSKKNKIEVNINDEVKVWVTKENFRKGISEDEGGYDDYNDEGSTYEVQLSGSSQEVENLLFSFDFKEEIVICTEYDLYTEEGVETRFYDVTYYNCECPDHLKKFFNGQFLLEDESGELSECKSDFYKNLIKGTDLIHDINGESEINSGTNIYKYSESPFINYKS
jgi:hypothetical protein